MSIYYFPGATVGGMPFEYITSYRSYTFLFGDFNYTPAADLSAIEGGHQIIETHEPTDPNVVVLGWHHDPETYEQIWDTRVKTVQELAAEAYSVRQIRRAQINGRFTELDTLSIRPIREVACGTASPRDVEKLAAYNLELKSLRSELAAINVLDDAYLNPPPTGE